MAGHRGDRGEDAMAGLYDGIEEVGFKPVAGGYVFQTNNPWLFGPRRRYFVTETQKAEIAGCIRETMRRIKPFVFTVSAIIPCLLIGAIFWFVFSGATLSVTETDAAGTTIVHTQRIGADGATGILAGEAGSRVIYKVSSAPGNGATVTVTPVSSAGKIGKPCTVRFDMRGNTITLTGDHNRIIRTAKLIGRAHPTQGATVLFSLLLAAALFGTYVAALHLYGTARLRPLLAGLPRSNERITAAEGIERFAARISNKLLIAFGIAAIAPLFTNAINLISAIHASRPIDMLALIGPAGSVLATVYFAYVLIVRLKLRRRAAATPD
jgi:hypothetical protein